MASSAIKLAVIGGDGIGPEVVAEALKVLQAANVGVDATTYDLGAERWHRTGETLPESVLAEIRDQDAILLGAVGDSRYLEVELSARLVVRGVAAPDLEFPEGAGVFACIRKEAVRVFRPRAGEQALGVIVAASYLGAVEEYLVDIAGVRIEAVGPAAGLTKGENVHVTMTADDWVFVR